MIAVAAGSALLALLDGLVLRFVGATFPQVLPFYVVGVALLLLLAPRLPEET